MRGSEGLPIFTHHAFRDESAITSTKPDSFRESMTRLIDAGWRCVDLPSWLRKGRPAVERGFALTFDDGDASILDVVDVFPGLGLTATVFLATSHVGGWNDWIGQPHWVPRSRLLDAKEITDLAGRGLSFGSHARTHPDLTKLDRDDLRTELRDSRAAVETLVNAPCDLIAYPYGRSSRLVRREAAEVYSHGLATTLAMAGANSPDFEIPRIDAYYLNRTNLLGRIISGEAESWLRWRNRLRIARRAALPEARR